MAKRYEKADARTVNLPPGAVDLSDVRRASLIVLSGGEIGREIELSEKVLILGRSVRADIRIPAKSVSRKHVRIALVEKDADRYYEITDLDSRNGTRVNNHLIKTARLEDGDKVHMGEVLFKFLLQDPLESRFHQDVHRLIHYDQLTGLLNMDAFWRRIEAEMHKRPERPFSLAMTDLDGLKRVNDTYGHLAGRMVVREMGRIMRKCLRDKDYGGLYGGDEAVLLHTEMRIEEAVQAAERLRERIEKHTFGYKGQSFHITISQGLAEWPRHGETPDDLIGAADGALYAAKAAGRNCVKCAEG